MIQNKVPFEECMEEEGWMEAEQRVSICKGHPVRISHWARRDLQRRNQAIAAKWPGRRLGLICLPTYRPDATNNTIEPTNPSRITPSEVVLGT